MMVVEILATIFAPNHILRTSICDHLAPRIGWSSRHAASFAWQHGRDPQGR